MLPLPHFARRSARWSRSQHRRARTNATRPDEPPATRTKIWLCGRTVMPDAFPVAAQEMLSAKPPHFRYPKGSLRQMGPRRLPARQRDRRPGSLKITSSCATTGCGVVTRLLFAVPDPRARCQWQAARQLAGILSRQPSAPPF